jgi:GxxExxY protein
VADKDLIYKAEAYRLVGICMNVHRALGHGFLEIVYKDALEWELTQLNISYERERQFQVCYTDTILRHSYYADFVIYGKIILEIKAASGIADEHVKQVLNYLAVSKCRLGLIVNFGVDSLQWKRVVL